MSNSSLVSYTKISPNRSTRTKKIDTITIHHMAGNLTVEQCGAVFAPKSRKASSNYGIGSDGRIGLYVEEKDRSWATSSSANDNRAVTIEVANNNTKTWTISDAAYKSLVALCADICKRNGISELKWQGDKSLKGKVDKQNMTVHRWYASTLCPGDYLYNLHGQIAKDVNAILSGGKTTTTKAEKPTEAKNEGTGYDLKTFIKDVQKATGAAVDGIAGAETIGKTITVSAKTNRMHPVVKALQKRLNALGFNCGTVDGIAGAKFTAAVKAYQLQNGCVSDGIITARNKTWKKLLGMA